MATAPHGRESAEQTTERPGAPTDPHAASGGLPETHSEAVTAAARIAELEGLVAAATEFRLMPPGLGRTPLIVRRNSAYAGTSWAVIHDPGDRAVRRAWTRGGWEMTAVLAHEELFCWPDGPTAVAEAQRLINAEETGR